MSLAIANAYKEVYSLLGQDQPRRKNVAIPLLTADQAGYVRVCLLSPYQVVMMHGKRGKKSKPRIFFAVYNGSTTNKNLRLRKKATLLIPTPPSVNYVRGSTRTICDFHLGDPNFRSTLYAMEANEVIRDYYPNAPIKSNLTFEVNQIKKQYLLYYEKIIELGKLKR